MTDAVELKNKYLSYPACTCNLLLAVTREGKINLPFWNADMEWTDLSIFSSPQVDSPHLFSQPRTYCLQTPQLDAVCFMASFFNMFSISTCIRSACSWPMCGVWGTLSYVGFFRKDMLNLFTIFKISWSFVSISHASKNILTFLLVARLELFLQRTSFLPMDKHSSDLLLEL